MSILSSGPASEAFIGRGAELSELRRSLASTLSGRGRLVLLVGEPGIGKSRLADEFAAEAESAGARVLWGRCWEGGGAPPYWPWNQIVRSYSADPDRAAPGAVETLTPLRALLAMPDRLGGGEGEPDHARFQLFDAAATFLREASSIQPLVLILDDLHAADLASLFLLRFVAREVRSAPWMVVGTYREAEVQQNPAVAALLAEIAREGQRLPLRGLNREETAGYLREAVSERAAGGLAQAVYDATDGNPFFVKEVARLLAHEVPADGKLPIVRIPDEVRSAIRQRFSLLSDACLGLLRYGAILGREFDLGTLREIAPSDLGDRAGALVEEACALRLLAAIAPGESRYRFVHLLIRDTLYDDLASDERMRLHLAAAEAMERIHANELHARAAEIAHHYCAAATIAGAEKAVEFSRLAGERAQAALAYEEAAGHYRRALACLDLRRRPADNRLRCELTLQLCDALWGGGDLSAMREACERAAAIAEHLPAGEREILFARAALAAGARQQRAHVALDPGIVSLLERALGYLGEEDSALRARLMARLAYALYMQPGSFERRGSLSQAALDMARRLSDPETLRWVLNDRRWALWGPDTIRERMAISSELVHLAVQRADREMALTEHAWRIVDSLELGDIAAFDAELAVYTRVAHEMRLPWYHWYVCRFRSLRAALLGQFAEAERAAQEAVDTAQRVQHQDALLIYSTQMMTVRVDLGQFEAIEAGVQAFAAQYPAMAVWQFLLTYLYAEQGKRSETQAVYDRITAVGLDRLPNDYVRLPNAAYLTEAAWFLRDAERAAPLYEILRPYGDRCIVIGYGVACFGSASRHLGMLAATLGRWEEANRHFEKAIEVNRRLDAQPALARTLAAFGDTVARQPGKRSERRKRAAELIGEASAIAERLSMVRLVARCREIAAEHGVAASAPAAPSPATASRAATFRIDNGYWEISFEGTEFRAKDLRGFGYLHHLLGHPGQEFAARQLVALYEPEYELDPETREAIAGLQHELASAEATGNLERAARARRAIEDAVRPEASPSLAKIAERARVSVTKRIGIATKKLAEHSPALARYLSQTIKTGALCGYRPDPSRGVQWRL